MDLRIIGGIYKRHAIHLPSNLCRPTLVRARKMIFDTILNRVQEEFTFLDVFAGSGIMGMEALSRGAITTFFELNKLLVDNLKKNLKQMPQLTKYFIYHLNSLRPIEGRPMDVVFIDPPYDKINIVNDVLKKLKRYNWIDNKTYVIIEAPEILSYDCFKLNRVSNSYIHFLNNNIMNNEFDDSSNLHDTDNDSINNTITDCHKE